MTEFIYRLVLYAYPIWALTSFAVGLSLLIDYLWRLDRRVPVLIAGVVLLGWAIAFFGAGLLIAQVVDRAIITPIIQSVWIVVLPLFVYVGALKCLATWRALRLVDRGKKRNRAS